MKQEFDPEMDALSGRKMKSAMKIVVSIDPDTGDVSAAHEGEEDKVQDAMDGAPDEGMDPSLMADMMKSEGAKDKAQDDANMASDEDRLKGDMMGGMSSGDTMEEFKDKAPRSLGQRVRYDIAKKAKPV